MREKLFHRDFTLVVIGQIISLLGNAVLRFVLPLYLLDVRPVLRRGVRAHGGADAPGRRGGGPSP